MLCFGFSGLVILVFILYIPVLYIPMFRVCMQDTFLYQIMVKLSCTLENLEFYIVEKQSYIIK